MGLVSKAGFYKGCYKGSYQVSYNGLDKGFYKGSIRRFMGIGRVT